MDAAHVIANPHDIQSIQWYCYTRAPEDMDEVVATLEEICQSEIDDGTDRAMHYMLLSHHKEIRDRIQNGLPRSNALSIDDWRFQFATAEVENWRKMAEQSLQLEPNSYGALSAMANALIAGGAPLEAEKHFSILRSDKQIDLLSVTNFDLSLHASLEKIAASAPTFMPHVKFASKASSSSKRLIYSACDTAFFERYGWIFLNSLKQHENDGIAVHVHLFDALDDEVDFVTHRLSERAIPQVSVSWERTELRGKDNAKLYYHVARFVRFWQFLNEHPDSRAWILDTDLIFNKSPDSLFNLLESHDVGLWLMPGRTDAANQVAAGLVGISPTPDGRAYIAKVAGYIASCIQSGVAPWGTDQTALFTVYSVLAHQGGAPDVAPVPAGVYDGYFSEHSVVWPGKCDSQSASFPRFQALVESLRFNASNLRRPMT